MHLAGISNGGLSAFYLATASPACFASIVTAPGSLARKTANMRTLSDIPVTLFVGEFDNWRDSVQDTYSTLRALGVQVSLEVLDGSKHELEELFGGARLYDVLDAARRQHQDDMDRSPRTTDPLND